MLPAPRVNAQQVEVSFGSGLSIPVRDTTYESRYLPPFPFVDHSGVAGQTISLEPGPGPMFWGALNWLRNSRAGLEVHVDYRRSSLSGANAPYDIAIRYVARQPPDFTPREFEFNNSLAWPDTDGHLDQLTVSAGLVVHAGRLQGAGARVFIGGGITNLRGQFDSLGYSTFALGGHSVIFPEDHQATMSLESTTTFGIGLGAEAHAPLNDRVALVAGYRLFIPREMEVPLRVEQLTPIGATFRDVTVDEAQVALAPAPLRIRPITSEITAGLRVRF